MRIKKSDILRKGAASLLLIGGCFTAMGEQPDSVYHQLDDIEVVAQRIKEEVSSSSPTFKLSDEKLKLMGVTDMADALHRLPGLNIRDYGGAGGMKTVSVRGLGTTHTGVIYDGIVLSDCQSGKIDLSRYSLDNVDDVSLVIGDNNDIFIPAKASASAATIIINTGSVPEWNDSIWHFTGQLRIGSFGLINPYIKIGKRLGKTFSFSAIGDYLHAKNNYPYTLYNGILVTKERRNNSLMNSGHGELNFKWRLTLGSIFEAKTYYYDNNRQLPGPVVLYNPMSDDTLYDKNFFGQLVYSNYSLSKFSFKALAKFNWDATYYHEVDGKYTAGYNDDNYIQRETYVSGSALYVPNDVLSFNYSVDYTYNNLTSNDVTTVRPWRHSVLQSMAAKFRTSRFLITGRLLYSIYDNGVKRGVSAADKNKLSPSLSISVKPLMNYLFFIRASYKNIFRMPTFNESYYYRMGSTSLKPENTDQFNIGLTWQYGSSGPLASMTLTGDFYYNRVKDKIVAIPMNMFIWTMTNLEKARAFGVDITLEASVDLSVKQSLLLAGNYSFQRVQPRTAKTDPDYNKQVAYTPVHSGAASLIWQNSWVDVVVRTTGSGDRYGTNSNLPITRIKGYMELGCGLMKKLNIRYHSLDFRLDLLNILNTQYEIVPSYPMPGRSFRFTATFNL